MYTKFVLFIPQAGINDCFSCILKVMSYCEMNKRTLLLDMTNSAYRINFSDYFYIKNCPIIYNSNAIKKILLSLQDDNSLTVYPDNLNLNLLDLFDKTKNISFTYCNESIRWYNNISLKLPMNSDANVILHSRSGGGNGFLFFKKVVLHGNIKNIIKKKINSLKENYLCIQVRNTDRKCDYKNLYKKNIHYIKSFHQLYICTDDKKAYEFFKSKFSNVLCFTRFPENQYKNLHRSNISPAIKMEDLLTDIFIAANSKSILSNSKGGFITLLRNCHKNKKIVLNMLS